jgi:hypothetical protein
MASALTVLGAFLGFVHCLVGFTNAQFVGRPGPILEDLSYCGRQATYDLHRLKRKGVGTLLEGTQRYQVTAIGRRIATWLPKAHGRVLTPGLAGSTPGCATGLPFQRDGSAKPSQGWWWQVHMGPLTSAPGSRQAHRPGPTPV